MQNAFIPGTYMLLSPILIISGRWSAENMCSMSILIWNLIYLYLYSTYMHKYVPKIELSTISTPITTMVHVEFDMMIIVENGTC